MSTPPIPPEQLRLRSDLSGLAFETTADLEEVGDILGQDRAYQAVRFGVGMRSDGHNIYVMGPPGTGKHTTVQRLVGEAAAEEQTPSDWCYVNNFQVRHKPIAIELPSGKGQVLRRDMMHLVENLKTGIPAVFESDEYRNQREMIEQEFKERQETLFEGVQKKASEMGVAMVRTPMGLALAPIKDGEVVTPDEFQKLPQEEREKFERDIEGLQKELQENIHELPKWDKERRDKLRDFTRQVTMIAVGHQLTALRETYKDFGNVVRYLDEVESDVIDNVTLFLPTPEGVAGALAMTGQGMPSPELMFRRYEVNVLVDNGPDNGGGGAPVIYEDHPTQPNLVGRAEHLAEMGALLTDFTLLRAGALHSANGGYLILDARKLLMQPYSYEELKRILNAREIRIEAPAQGLGFSTVSLQPQPIPLDVKVILLGDRRIYYLLCMQDPEFDELFKVAADFEDDIDRDHDNTGQYVKLIGSLARRAKLRPLDRPAVARVLEHSARLASDSSKLTARVALIEDLLREADYLASNAKRETIAREDIEEAIRGQIWRADRIRDRGLESISDGVILIDTEGEQVGQINGLAVMSLGNTAFGRPSRITARVRMGRGEVVDIEREAELGGPTHSKGVLILSNFLGARYAVDKPLSLSASLVFEQSYGGVDGDSASSTELYAILSALSGVPIKQGFAVTGSVNQLGRVQAIGGVNEKIEGFFDVCKNRGLTGEQGVLIPAANVKHLMLREDVVEAAAAGKFAIYSVESIDQGIEILTGISAGERGPEGQFPEGTINRRVEERLAELAEARRRFGSRDSNERQDGNT